MIKDILPEGKQVNDMSDKQECLQVKAQSKDGVTEGATIPFNRIGKEVFLGETMYSPFTKSNLLSLFWEAVNEQQD